MSTLSSLSRSIDDGAAPNQGARLQTNQLTNFDNGETVRIVRSHPASLVSHPERESPPRRQIVSDDSVYPTQGTLISELDLSHQLPLGPAQLLRGHEQNQQQQRNRRLQQGRSIGSRHYHLGTSTNHSTSQPARQSNGSERFLGIRYLPATFRFAFSQSQDVLTAMAQLEEQLRQERGVAITEKDNDTTSKESPVDIEALPRPPIERRRSEELRTQKNATSLIGDFKKLSLPDIVSLKKAFEPFARWEGCTNPTIMTLLLKYYPNIDCLYLSPTLPPSNKSYNPYIMKLVSPGKTSMSSYCVMRREGVSRYVQGKRPHTMSLRRWTFEQKTTLALKEIPFFKNFRLAKCFAGLASCVDMSPFGRNRRKLRSCLCQSQAGLWDVLLLARTMCLDMEALSMTHLDSELTYTLNEFMEDQEHYTCDVTNRIERYFAMLLHLTSRACWDDVISAGLAVERESRKTSAPKRINELRKMQRMKRSPSPVSGNTPDDVVVGEWKTSDPPSSTSCDLETEKLANCQRLSRFIYQVDCMLRESLRKVLLKSLERASDYLDLQLTTFPSEEDIRLMVKGYLGELDSVDPSSLGFDGGGGGSGGGGGGGRTGGEDGSSTSDSQVQFFADLSSDCGGLDEGGLQGEGGTGGGPGMNAKTSAKGPLDDVATETRRKTPRNSRETRSSTLSAHSLAPRIGLPNTTPVVNNAGAGRAAANTNPITASTTPTTVIATRSNGVTPMRAADTMVEATTSSASGPAAIQSGNEANSSQTMAADSMSCASDTLNLISPTEPSRGENHTESDPIFISGQTTETSTITTTSSSADSQNNWLHHVFFPINPPDEERHQNLHPPAGSVDQISNQHGAGLETDLDAAANMMSVRSGTQRVISEGDFLRFLAMAEQMGLDIDIELDDSDFSEAFERFLDSGIAMEVSETQDSEACKIKLKAQDLKSQPSDITITSDEDSSPLVRSRAGLEANQCHKSQQSVMSENPFVSVSTTPFSVMKVNTSSLSQSKDSVSKSEHSVVTKESSEPSINGKSSDSNGVGSFHADILTYPSKTKTIPSKTLSPSSSSPRRKSTSCLSPRAKREKAKGRPPRGANKTLNVRPKKGEMCVMMSNKSGSSKRNSLNSTPVPLGKCKTGTTSPKAEKATHFCPSGSKPESTKAIRKNSPQGKSHQKIPVNRPPTSSHEKKKPFGRTAKPALKRSCTKTKPSCSKDLKQTSACTVGPPVRDSVHENNQLEGLHTNGKASSQDIEKKEDKEKRSNEASSISLDSSDQEDSGEEPTSRKLSRKEKREQFKLKTRAISHGHDRNCLLGNSSMVCKNQQNANEDKGIHSPSFPSTKSSLASELHLNTDSLCPTPSEYLLQDSGLSELFMELYRQVVESSVDAEASLEKTEEKNRENMYLFVPVLDGTSWSMDESDQNLSVRALQESSVDVINNDKEANEEESVEFKEVPVLNTPAASLPANYSVSQRDKENLGESKYETGLRKGIPLRVESHYNREEADKAKKAFIKLSDLKKALEKQDSGTRDPTSLHMEARPTLSSKSLPLANSKATKTNNDVSKLKTGEKSEVKSGGKEPAQVFSKRLQFDPKDIAPKNLIGKGAAQVKEPESKSELSFSYSSLQKPVESDTELDQSTGDVMSDLSSQKSKANVNQSKILSESLVCTNNVPKNFLKRNSRCLNKSQAIFVDGLQYKVKTKSADKVSSSECDKVFFEEELKPYIEDDKKSILKNATSKFLSNNTSVPIQRAVNLPDSKANRVMRSANDSARSSATSGGGSKSLGSRAGVSGGQGGVGPSRRGRGRKGGGGSPPFNSGVAITSGKMPVLKPMFHAAVTLNNGVVAMVPDIYDFTAAAFNMIHNMEEHMLTIGTLTSHPAFSSFLQPMLAGLAAVDAKHQGPSLEMVLRHDPRTYSFKNNIYGWVDSAFHFAGIYLREMRKLYTRFFVDTRSEPLNLDSKAVAYFYMQLRLHDTQMKIAERLPEYQKLGVFLFDLAPYKDYVRDVGHSSRHLTNRKLTDYISRKIHILLENLSNLQAVLESTPSTTDLLFHRLKAMDETEKRLEHIQEFSVGELAALYDIIDSYDVPHLLSERQTFESIHYMVSSVKAACQKSLEERTEVVREIERLLVRDVAWVEMQVKRELRPLVDRKLFLDGQADNKEVKTALTQTETAVRSLVAKANFVREVQRYLEMPESHFKELFQVSSRHVNTRNLWLLMADWDTKLDKWKNQDFSTLDIQQINSYTFKYMEACDRLEKVLPKNSVTTVFGEKMDVMLRWLNFMIEFRGHVIKPRHWSAIAESLGVEFGPDLPLTLANLMAINAIDKQKNLHGILNRARAESNIQSEYDEVIRQCQEQVVPVQVRDKVLVEGEEPVTLNLLMDAFEVEESWNYCVMELERIDLSPHSSFLHDELTEFVQKIFVALENMVQWSEFQMKLSRTRRLVMRHPDVTTHQPALVNRYKQIFIAHSNFLEQVSKDPNAFNCTLSTELVQFIEAFSDEVSVMYRSLKRDIESRSGQGQDPNTRDQSTFGTWVIM